MCVIYYRRTSKFPNSPADKVSMHYARHRLPSLHLTEKAVYGLTVPRTACYVRVRRTIASVSRAERLAYYTSYSSASTDDGFNVVVPAPGAEEARPSLSPQTTERRADKAASGS